MPRSARIGEVRLITARSSQDESMSARPVRGSLRSRPCVTRPACQGRPHNPSNAVTSDWSWTFYFRTADFFADADLLRGAPFGGLRASLAALPAWNRTALLAAILMVSPLCGFRPLRAGRAATLKVPRPETRTASPAIRESRIALTTAFTACPATTWFSQLRERLFRSSSIRYGTPNWDRTSSALSRSVS